MLGGSRASDVVDPLIGDHDGIFARDEVWSHLSFMHKIFRYQ